MLNNRRSVLLTVLAFALGACGDKITAPAQQELPPQVVLPAFHQDYDVATMGNGVRNQQIQYCAPKAVYPDVYVSTTTTAVAILPRDLKEDHSFACPTGYGGWALTVFYEVREVGSTMVTVSLRDNPQQQSSFRVIVLAEPMPYVEFTADQNLVGWGNGTYLHWSAPNANSCYVSGTNSGPQGGYGAVYSGNLYQNTTFTITCSNTSGNSSATVKVYVAG